MQSDRRNSAAPVRPRKASGEAMSCVRIRPSVPLRSGLPGRAGGLFYKNAVLVFPKQGKCDIMIGPDAKSPARLVEIGGDFFLSSSAHPALYSAGWTLPHPNTTDTRRSAVFTSDSSARNKSRMTKRETDRHQEFPLRLSLAGPAARTRRRSRGNRRKRPL